MKVRQTDVLLVLLLLTAVLPSKGLWPWDDPDDEDTETTASPKEDGDIPVDDEDGEDIGSGDIFIDGETSTPPPPPSSTEPTTTTTTTTTTIPTTITTTTVSTVEDTPSPRTRESEMDNIPTRPPPVTHPNPWSLPPPRGHSGQSGSLHRDAIILQRHLDSCPYCLRRQDPVMMCPAHQVAVEIETWAKQLHNILSQGCSMGPMDQEKCCLNGDSRVLGTLRDVTQRLRDVHHVLLASCSSCPRHGGWSEWTEWSHCTVTCGSGTRERTRSCSNPPPKNGGRPCEGRDRESHYCHLAEAPLNGGWGQWEVWSSCSTSCGEGTRMRIRACNNPPPNACGKKCAGSDFESDRCHQQACCSPINGNWSPWAQWSPCSVTCGVGNRERIRTCTSPTPNQCGQQCVGADREQTGCEAGDCCSHGAWGEWAPWSTCSVTCGSGGVKERSRRCDSPAPNRCGETCLGSPTESTSCNCKNCCEDGVWGSWGPWSDCSVSCGPGGVKQRSRTCDSPAPNWCGKKCPGQREESTSCDCQPCACEPDKWSTWGPWSHCSVTCGEGLATRSRSCVVSSSNPCRQGCPGQDFKSRNCGNRDCCEPDKWSTWGPWSHCSVTCGEGLATRSRTCVVSSSNPCRKGCPGQDFMSRDCGDRDCCEPDRWSAWGPWSPCSVTCGEGLATRSRMCVMSGSNSCRRGCAGQDSESRNCRDGQCCAWSRWSEWTGCSVSCVTTSQLPNRVRTRSCVTTADPRRPCPRRQACRGPRSQTDKCLVPQCRPPATWGEWGLWCPCNCRRGVKSRRRACELDGREMDNNQCQGQARQELFCDVRKEATCPDCITSCADKEDGTYPSCNGCSFYILCQYKRTTVQRCQSNFQWDAHKSECVTPPSDSCSLKEPLASCRDAGADGLYHSQGGCGRYLQCSRGQGSQQSCPSRQEFNAHSQMCETTPSPTCIRQLERYLLAPLLRYPLQDSPGDSSDEKDKSDDSNKDKGKEKKKKRRRRKKKKKKKDKAQKEGDVENAEESSQGTNQEDSDKEKQQMKTPPVKLDIKDADTATLKKTSEKKSENIVLKKNHLENDDSESQEKKKTRRRVVPEADTPNTSDTKVGKIRHSAAKARHDHHHNPAEENKKPTSREMNKNAPCYANCQGLEKGRKYQSCQGCRFYLFCSLSGSAQIRRCHGNRVWDGISQRCKQRSRTCGQKAGDYIP